MTLTCHEVWVLLPDLQNILIRVLLALLRLLSDPSVLRINDPSRLVRTAIEVAFIKTLQRLLAEV